MNWYVEITLDNGRTMILAAPATWSQGQFLNAIYAANDANWAGFGGASLTRVGTFQQAETSPTGSAWTLDNSFFSGDQGGGEGPPPSGGDQPEYGPYTQYLAQIGRGAAEYGPAAGYERGLYDPLRGLYEAEQRFAPVGMAQGGATAGPGEWSSYMQQGGAGIGGQANMYNRASALLKQQMGLTPAERSAYGVSWAPTFSETGDAGYDVSPEMQKLLLQMGTRSAYGARGSQRFASQLPREREIWLQEQTAGSQEGFLDYLNAKYGLGSFMGG